MSCATLQMELESLERALLEARLELERQRERRAREVAMELDAIRAECDELRYEVDDASSSIGWARAELRVLKAGPARRSPAAGPGWPACAVALSVAAALWMMLA